MFGSMFIIINKIDKKIEITLKNNVSFNLKEMIILNRPLPKDLINLICY